MWLVLHFPSFQNRLFLLSPSFSLSSLRFVSSPKPSNEHGCTGAHRDHLLTRFRSPVVPTTTTSTPDNQKKIKGGRGTEPPRVVHLNNPRLLNWCRQPRLATNQTSELHSNGQLPFLRSFLRSTLTLRVNVEARGHRVVLAAHLNSIHLIVHYIPHPAYCKPPIHSRNEFYRERHYADGSADGCYT